MARATNATELERRLAAIKYVQGSIKHLAPGRSLADELIENRRAEARAEQAGDRGSRR